MINMTNIEITVIAWCLGVAVIDIYARRIPNILTVAPCVLGLICLMSTGQALLGAQWQSVVIGTAVSILMTLPAYIARILGAGDVKLLLAIALLGGWYLTLFAFVIASTLAFVFTVTDFILTKASLVQKKTNRWFPFGSALSAGLLLAFVVTK